MNYENINSHSSIIDRNLPTSHQGNDSKNKESVKLMLKSGTNGVLLMAVGNNLKPLEVDTLKADNSPAAPIIHAMKMEYSRMEDEFNWSGERVDTSVV